MLVGLYGRYVLRPLREPSGSLCSPVEETMQRTAQGNLVSGDRRTARHRDDLESCQVQLPLAECLAQKPLQTIPVDSTPGALLRHSEAEAGRLAVFESNQQCEVPVGHALRGREDPAVVTAVEQARGAREGGWA